MDSIVSLVEFFFFTFVCILLWFSFNKKINNKILKSILFGLVTCFFFYQFSVHFIIPVAYILYKIGLYPDNQGIIVLLVQIFAKPLSIFSGVMITIILLIKDELI
jgi:hypothetical protein